MCHLTEFSNILEKSVSLFPSYKGENRNPNNLRTCLSFYSQCQSLVSGLRAPGYKSIASDQNCIDSATAFTFYSTVYLYP